MRITYDLHIHSALSPCADNDMTPGNIVGMAYLNGLDLIAITDHQSCANVASAIAAAQLLREETGRAPAIIPGMEIECAEGFHMLAFFPDLSSAVAFEEYMQAHRLLIPNRPDIFGEQYLFDKDDEICGTMRNLLLTASDFSSYELAAEIGARGGCTVPAHIDRDSYSIIASLGCVPEDFPGKNLEISKSCDRLLFLKMHPELAGYGFLQNSDAHRLTDIACPGNVLDIDGIDPDNFVRRVVETLREKICR